VAENGAGALGGSPHAGYLLGVLVFLVTLGVLGMHAVGSGHMAHALVAHSTPSIVGTPSAHSSGHDVVPATDVLPAVAVADANPSGVLDAWAASCDGGGECDTRPANRACLAVLVLLLYLVLGRGHLRTLQRDGRRTASPGAPRGRPPPRPLLHVLCISRT